MSKSSRTASRSTATTTAAKRAAKTAKTTTEKTAMPTATKTASRKTAAKRGTKTSRRQTAAAIAMHVVRVPAATLLETSTATHVSRSKSALATTKTRAEFKIKSVERTAKSVRITYANGSTIRPAMTADVYALVPVEPVAAPVETKTTRAKRAASTAKTKTAAPVETTDVESVDVLAEIAAIAAKIDKRGHATSAESRKLDALRAQRDAATKIAKRAKTSGRKTTTKIGTAAVAKWTDTAAAATTYMNAAASGGRNPVSTQNVADVAALVGRKNAIAAICGESASIAECKRLVRGTETKNAAAIRTALRDFAQRITDASDSGRTTKIRGAKLLGIAIALAESK